MAWAGIVRIPLSPTLPCMDAKLIATVPFIDGITRDVYFDLDCRQFVHDEDGTPIYVWRVDSH
jgi:hypothetical protein